MTEYVTDGQVGFGNNWQKIFGSLKVRLFGEEKIEIDTVIKDIMEEDSWRYRERKRERVKSHIENRGEHWEFL